MVRIDPKADLMVLIRARATGSRSVEGRKEYRHVVSPSVGPRPRLVSGEAAAHLGDAGVLAPALRLRLSALAENDPARYRKAMRIFLESALLKGLSTSLRNDPGFDALVDQVQLQMESDPLLRDACRVAAESLLKHGNVAPLPTSELE